MLNVVKKLIFMMMLLLSGAAMAAIQQGKDYTLLQPEMPTNSKKIEVLEFFFYECSHCNDLHPHLDAWKKTKPADVDLIYVPTMFRDSTEPLARAFYTLENMGKLDAVNSLIYDAIHKKNQRFNDLDAVAAFVEKNGVDRKKFEGIYKSFATQSKITRAKQMIRSYRIQGTPTIVVNGKYVITGLHPADTIRVLNEVIEKIRKEGK